MNENKVRELLENVSRGSLSNDNATEKLKSIPFEDLEFAHVDHLRSLRKGFPEVIYGEGKTSEQIVSILEKMVVHEVTILVTRLSKELPSRISPS